MRPAARRTRCGPAEEPKKPGSASWWLTAIGTPVACSASESRLGHVGHRCICVMPPVASGAPGILAGRDVLPSRPPGSRGIGQLPWTWIGAGQGRSTICRRSAVTLMRGRGAAGPWSSRIEPASFHRSVPRLAGGMQCSRDLRPVFRWFRVGSLPLKYSARAGNAGQKGDVLGQAARLAVFPGTGAAGVAFSELANRHEKPGSETPMMFRKTRRDSPVKRGVPVAREMIRATGQGLRLHRFGAPVMHGVPRTRQNLITCAYGITPPATLGAPARPERAGSFAVSGPRTARRLLPPGSTGSAP